MVQKTVIKVEGVEHDVTPPHAPCLIDMLSSDKRYLLAKGWHFIDQNGVAYGEGKDEAFGNGNEYYLKKDGPDSIIYEISIGSHVGLIKDWAVRRNIMFVSCRFNINPVRYEDEEMYDLILDSERKKNIVFTDSSSLTSFLESHPEIERLPTFISIYERDLKAIQPLVKYYVPLIGEGVPENESLAILEKNRTDICIIQVAQWLGFPGDSVEEIVANELNKMQFLFVLSERQNAEYIKNSLGLNDENCGYFDPKDPERAGYLMKEAPNKMVISDLSSLNVLFEQNPEVNIRSLPAIMAFHDRELERQDHVKYRMVDYFHPLSQIDDSCRIQKMAFVINTAPRLRELDVF